MSIDVKEMTEEQIIELRNRIIASALVDAAGTAYNAYGDHAKWLNYQGATMPQWNELPANIAEHWIAAVTAILVIRTA